MHSKDPSAAGSGSNAAKRSPRARRKGFISRPRTLLKATRTGGVGVHSTRKLNMINGTLRGSQGRTAISHR